MTVLCFSSQQPCLTKSWLPRNLSSSSSSLRPSHSPSTTLPLKPTTTSRHFPRKTVEPYNHGVESDPLLRQCNPLKIAIIGFGNYGQFLAKTFVHQGHTVLAHSRSNHCDDAQKLGVTYFRDIFDLCEEHPEVVVLSTSIIFMQEVLKSIPFQSLLRSTLFVDVLSVKEYPRELLLKHLPTEFDILCTHPMFGPESGKVSWDGLTFVFEKVRTWNSESRMERRERFLDIFAIEGCKMVEMSCAEHDKYAAKTQFVADTIGRLLKNYGSEPSPIDTEDNEALLALMENTANDSFDSYFALFMYNKNAIEQLEKLDEAFESLKKVVYRHQNLDLGASANQVADTSLQPLH
ncbi:hypothetical protein L6164_004517 [Bauhinia variegata]|uniref:Uncharacterized protein n=1 Tax=Bauhinia variegata TaxID=167791 RepID=A0ACB9Q4P7_BAUVA|nr:hypothetical protein L6164_004517 [Bauhinia variegata]